MEKSGELKKIASGSVIVSIGIILSTILQFAAGIMVIRILDRDEFGLISLGYTIAMILGFVAILGMRTGLPRILARCREQRNREEAGLTLGSALGVAIMTTLFAAIITYLAAPAIAAGFDMPGLEIVMVAFALLVPPLGIGRVLTAVFQGIENARAKVWFEDIAQNLLRICLLVLVIALGMGLHGVIWAYIASIWISFVAYMTYAGVKVLRQYRLGVSAASVKAILGFCLPLLGVGLAGHIMGWAGTLSLGAMHSADDVALFNAPLRLATLIAVPLTAMLYLYLPVATRLHTRGSHEKLGILYINTTKWVFLLSLPLLLYILFNAEFIVTRLFGPEYLESADILRILVIGFSVHSFLGPNGSTLITLGHTQSVFTGSLIMAISMVLLCLVLVPEGAAFGAALASAASRALSNIYLSINLYMRTRIHAFNKQHLKPILFATVAGWCIHALLGLEMESSLIFHLLEFALLTGVAISAPLLTAALNSEDRELMHALRRRLARRTSGYPPKT